MCIKVFIFCFNTHKKTQKKLKKRENQKEPKKKRGKKMLLLTVFVENLTEITDQPTKAEHVLKTINLEKHL